MSIEKIMNDFIDEYLKRGTYATREGLLSIISDVKELVLSNKDVTVEELIDFMLEKNISELEDIRRKYPTPGYTVSINVLNYNIKLYGGNLNYLGEEMKENALFDIASMTKFYTQAVLYNLIKEDYIRFSDKVKDLDPRFINLEDVTIGDISTFTAEFRTNERISDKKTIDEAKNTLYNVNVVNKGKYNYNDIGMMIIKEVMEYVTNTKFEDLVDKYIIKPFNLSDTHLIVPKHKFKLLTGSPNDCCGRVNDMSANALGGFSGHAGMFASSDDLIKLMKGVYHNNVVNDISNTYTHGINDARGIVGNTYTTHPKGLNVSYLDVVESIDSFAIQGSTRVNATGSFDSAHTVLFNPDSMSFDRAKLEEEKINFKREKEGKEKLSLVKSFEFNRNGKLIKYHLIDARQMLPTSETVEKVIKSNAELILKLRFLNRLIKEYDRSYGQKEIKMVKRIK